MAAACLSEKMNLMATKRQKRREKSRDAARFRRNKESNTFDEICNSIPVPQEVLNHLDKSAIMRMLISYIKLREVMNGRNQNQIKKEIFNEGLITDNDYVNSLNGFLLILSSDHDVLYVSDNVKDYLGLSKFDLMGQSIFQYTHEGDHEDLKACFAANTENTSVFLRMKSTLTVNGRNINLKSASYKVLRCSGVVCQGSDESSYMVAHAEPLPHPANIEHLLDSMTFVSQHSPDMKFTYCDEKFTKLLAYDESDLLDRSFFDFCHVADMKPINDYFHKLYRLNQVETNLYRFLAKTGGYLWVVTQATVIANQKSHKPQCIVCVHYVISGMEHEGVPLSSEQLINCVPAMCDPVESSNVENETEIEEVDEIMFETDISPYCSSFEDDDCSFVPLTFDELDDTDGYLTEELCFNAPSIGDPWSYSERTTPETVCTIEDVFSDVVLDNSQPSQKLTYNPQTLNELPPLNSQPESLPTWRTSPAYPTSMGSASPCDSAYCGSPSPEPLLSYSSNPSPSGVSSEQRPPQSGPPMKWQSIGVPREQYAQHMNHLKRGHLQIEDADISEWLSDNDAKKAKRLRYIPNKKAASKSPNWNPLKNPVALLQPGENFGCDGGENSMMDFGTSMLLQPELNLNSKLGSSLVRNLSSGFLPEISVRDCEVNAPLCDARAAVPLATDCVQMLNSAA